MSFIEDLYKEIGHSTKDREPMRLLDAAALLRRTAETHYEGCIASLRQRIRDRKPSQLTKAERREIQAALRDGGIDPSRWFPEVLAHVRDYYDDQGAYEPFFKTASVWRRRARIIEDIYKEIGHSTKDREPMWLLCAAADLQKRTGACVTGTEAKRQWSHFVAVFLEMLVFRHKHVNPKSLRV